VHVHLFAGGLLFTFALCQLDPVRHRYGLLPRAAVLVAAGTAHSVLAKVLYGTSPPGTAFPGHDLARGAELMYYGGDLVEIALAAVLAAQWYAAGGRDLDRRNRRAADAGSGGEHRPYAAASLSGGSIGPPEEQMSRLCNSRPTGGGSSLP
jgi:putative membrane protein